MSELVLAVDVGGTKAHGALLDRGHTIIAERVAATTGRDPGLVATLGVVEDLLAGAERDGHTVRAIAAGFPEYVSPDGKLAAREVLDWREQPAFSLARLGGHIPVVVESDARCGALGELSFGHGREERDFVYVSLGTGLSSSIVLDGSVHVGRRGEAIALGEFAVSAPTGDRWQGNLESYASGTGIATRFAAANATESLNGGARVVVEAAANGDAVAADILLSAGTAIGAALAQIAFLLDPPLFVLGGGLGVVETPITSAIHSQFESMTQRRPNPPRVRRSSVATNVGLLGAAVAAWQATTV